MERERFEELVAAAVEELPEEFLERMENIIVVVEDYPTPSQLRKSGIGQNKTLLGLYEGVPLSRRSSGYGMVPPDKVTIFQGPIEAKCRTDNKIAEEIKRVVKHEIAHHFGISDERLDELDEIRRRNRASGAG